MATVDKNKAMITYLLQCPNIQNSPLYFNFINAKDNHIQIITSYEDRQSSPKYTDGSVMRTLSFRIIKFTSITDLAVVKTSGYPNENVEELEDIQAIIDWVEEQEKIRNYPNFGLHCLIDSISTSSRTPNLDGINADLTPPLAMYSITIKVNYLDSTDCIWNN